MTDDQIYVLMARTPNIRALQIADALDQDLPAVSSALRSLVEVGDIIQSKGLAPNGHQAQVYNFSDGFKETKAYQAAVAASDMNAKPAIQITPSENPAEAPAAQTFAPPTQARTSKAQLGAAYIAMHSPTKDADLRTAMDLSKGQYPAAYLTAAISNGLVHKDGSLWKPGPAPKVERMPSADKTELATSPEPAITPPAAAPIAVPPTLPAEATFRCGIWSDGVLELQRDGSTVAALQRAEGEQLTSFINRMLLSPQATSAET